MTRQIYEWPITLQKNSVKLEKLSQSDCADCDLVKQITSWRSAHESSFLSRFVPTEIRTSAWLANTFVSDQSNALYLIRENGRLIGHIGARSTSPESIEIDNVLKGVESFSRQTMSLALDLLLKHLTKSNKKIGIFLRVLSNNSRARRLYENAGFRVVQEDRLRQVFTGTESHLEPCEAQVSNVEETLLTMKFDPAVKEIRGTS